MASTKTRHDFLADADVTKLLAELVEGSGATKTEIIIQSVKAFAERGDDSEFAQRTAKRFDTLSRGLEAVRSDLKAIRQDRDEVRDQMKLILTSIEVFVSMSLLLSAHVPSPNDDLRATARKRLHVFNEEVDRKIAKGKATDGPVEEKKTA